jgi:hypothetical protein
MRFMMAWSVRLAVLFVPGGVQPPRGCSRRILSPLRLPVPPSRLGDGTCFNRDTGWLHSSCLSTLKLEGTPWNSLQLFLFAATRRSA